MIRDPKLASRASPRRSREMCPVIRDIKQQAARVIIIITSNRGMLGMTEVIGPERELTLRVF